MRVETIIVGPLATNCHIAACEETGEALIIDPGGDPEEIARAVERLGVRPVLVVLTHGHSDHMAAAAETARRYGAEVAMHPDDGETLARSIADAPLWGLGSPAPVTIGRELGAGDKVRFGRQEATVLHTPGHTRGGICLALDGAVFAGDTLFARSIGRTDFFGGDMETIIESIRRELLALPDETVVYTGHGPATTIGEERRENPFVAGGFV